MPADLTPTDALVNLARETREKAYAPYSGFQVGAALLTEDGRMVPGANVENASYGLTVCAERVAVTRAVADGHRRFKSIAVVADGPRLTPPCGPCLQTLAEFAPEIRVVLANLTGDRAVYKLGDLLPLAFGPKDLAETKK